MLPQPLRAAVGPIILLLCTSAFAQKPTPQPQESFAPYWTTEPGWRTELQLKNNLAQAPLTVTPVLRLASGHEISLRPVTIPSQSVRSVDIATELAKVAPQLATQQDLFGSVAFRFIGTGDRNLYAAVMVHMHGQPIGYHVDAFPAMADAKEAKAAGSREGIWWMPHPGIKDFLVISNGSEHTIAGTLYLSDAAGKQWKQALPLAPHEAKRFIVSELVKSAGFTSAFGGIKYDMPAFADAVDSVHFLYDDTVGFSALMKMFDRDPVAKMKERAWSGNTKWTMWAPMLALESPDPAVGFPAGTILQPYLFLYNTTAQPVRADVSLAWRGSSGKGLAAIPTLTLKPFETQRVDITSLQKRLNIPADAHWALVKLVGSNNPDDIVAVAASYDQTGRYGAQTPFSDQLSEHWVGGQWQVDQTHNSIVAVGNGGDKPTDALLTIHYNDGKDKYEIQQTIAPGDQMWLNFGDLIHNGIPDRNGAVLPSTLTTGAYDLKDLSFGHGGSLFEGKVILDKTWGHLAYGCLICCTYEATWLDQDPTSVGIGSIASLKAMGTNSCDGNDYGLNSYFSGNWWSGNSSIAGVQRFQTNGVGFGNTNGFATGQLPGQAVKSCPMRPVTAGNALVSGKTVTYQGGSCGPDPLNPGQVTLTGNWGDPKNLTSCLLSAHINGPAGGSCTTLNSGPGGIAKSCYQVKNASGCVTTSCPSNVRVVDSQCFNFLDPFPFTEVSTGPPGACSNN